MQWKDVTYNLEQHDTSSPNKLYKSWLTHIRKTMPDLESLCIEDSQSYDYQTQVYPIMKKAWLDRLIIDEVRETFNLLSGFIEKRFTEAFGDLEVTIVLYPGLCNGAGWVTPIDENMHILLGIEKIVELKWTSMEKLFDLINHELGHVLMINARKKGEEAYPTEPSKSVFQLFSEGVAEYVSQTLSPNENIRGKAWGSWCQASHDRIAETFLLRLEDKASTQDFFGDWVTLFGKSDLGYYLGQQFLNSLLDKWSLEEVLVLPIETLHDALLIYLKKSL